VRSAFLQTAIVVVLLTSQPLLCSAVCPSALHQTTLANFVLNQDGTRIAAVAHDGTLFWWDLRDGKRTELLDCLKSPFGPALSFSPDSALLAVTGKGGVLLFEIATGKLRATLRGNCPNAEQIVFSGNGERLAVSGDDALCVWQVADAKQVFVLRGLVELAFSLDPQGRSLLVAKHHRIERWDLTKNAMISSVKLSSNENATALALDEHDGWIIAQVGEPLPPNGERRLSRYLYHLSVWDEATGTKLKEIPGETGELAYPLHVVSGHRLLAITYEGMLYVWDLSEERLSRSLRIGTFAISGDGTVIAAKRSYVPARIEAWPLEQPEMQHKTFTYRSPVCEAVPPEKTRFEMTILGDSRTEDGAVIGWRLFVAQDCTPVSYSHAWLDSAEHAKKELQRNLKRATRVLDQRPAEEFHPFAVLGERVVALVPGTEPDIPYYAVMWTEGKDFYQVGSSSLDTALAFERQIFSQSKTQLR
jgi:hypothetical protein